MTYSATASDLSDKSLFPAVSRACVSDATHAVALIDIARKTFQWRRFVLLYQNDDYGRGFASTMRPLTVQLQLQMLEVPFQPGTDTDALISQKDAIQTILNNDINSIILIDEQVCVSACAPFSFEGSGLSRRCFSFSTVVCVRFALVGCCGSLDRCRCSKSRLRWTTRGCSAQPPRDGSRFSLPKRCPPTLSSKVV